MTDAISSMVNEYTGVVRTIPYATRSWMKSLTYTLTVALCMMLPPTADAQMFESQQIVKAKRELIPWFETLAKQIQCQPSWKKLDSALLKQLAPGRYELVTCSIAQDGELDRVKLVSFSESPKIDQLTLELINGLRSVDPPPNKLPVRRGIRIYFFVENGQKVKLSCLLGPYNGPLDMQSTDVYDELH